LRPGSDVDLMVEFKPSSTTTSFDLIDLQDELSALFGNRKVEITSPDILKNPYRRRTIERDLRTLYAARR
jgi:predicted nucleotidyltransferase